MYCKTMNKPLWFIKFEGKKGGLLEGGYLRLIKNFLLLLPCARCDGSEARGLMISRIRCSLDGWKGS